MKLWRWFCKLGDNRVMKFTGNKKNIAIDKQVSEQISQSGVDMVCSRICGHDGCKCGSTARGLHCVWSYYRLEK